MVSSTFQFQFNFDLIPTRFEFTVRVTLEGRGGWLQFKLMRLLALRLLIWLKTLCLTVFCSWDYWCKEDPTGNGSKNEARDCGKKCIFKISLGHPNFVGTRRLFAKALTKSSSTISCCFNGDCRLCEAETWSWIHPKWMKLNKVAIEIVPSKTVFH